MRGKVEVLEKASYLEKIKFKKTLKLQILH
jgi:hypothetical protein